MTWPASPMWRRDCAAICDEHITASVNMPEQEDSFRRAVELAQKVWKMILPIMTLRKGSALDCTCWV